MGLGKHAVESHSNPGAQKELRGDPKEWGCVEVDDMYVCCLQVNVVNTSMPRKVDLILKHKEKSKDIVKGKDVRLLTCMFAVFR